MAEASKSRQQTGEVDHARSSTRGGVQGDGLVILFGEDLRHHAGESPSGTELDEGPAVHIAVLRRGEVLESLDELFAMERDDFLSGSLSGSMNLISGPSKTGDIEGTIVTGIHGPLEVHLVILDHS